MFFVYGVYNNSLEMMFIRLGLLTRKVSRSEEHTSELQSH